MESLWLLSILLIFIIYSCRADHFTPVASSITKGKSFLAKTNTLQTNVEESTTFDDLLACFIGGPIIFLFSFVLLWYNERSYVISCHRLDLELQECADLDPDFYTEDHNKHLVYIQGYTSSDENLDKKDFPTLSAFNVIKLVKKVEMYQWIETKHKRTCEQNYYTYSLG